MEIHFKQQERVVLAQTRLQKAQMDLFSTQGEMASSISIEFKLDPSLVGLAIGSKGSRIKRIEAENNVTVRVSSESESFIKFSILSYHFHSICRLFQFI